MQVRLCRTGGGLQLQPAFSSVLSDSVRVAVKMEAYLSERWPLQQIWNLLSNGMARRRIRPSECGGYCRNGAGFHVEWRGG